MNRTDRLARAARRHLPRIAAAVTAVLALTAAKGGCDYGGPHGHLHAYAQRIFGNDPAQQSCLSALWARESGWSAYAVNPSSGAYGIPQALPADWGHPYALGDWRAQIRWGYWYIRSRYGSPCAAWSHEQASGWY